MNISKNHLLDPSKTEGVCLTLFFALFLIWISKHHEATLIQHKPPKPGVTVWLQTTQDDHTRSYQVIPNWPFYSLLGCSWKLYSKYIVSKLVYNLFRGLTTYLYIGVIIQLLGTMDIPVVGDHLTFRKGSRFHHPKKVTTNCQVHVYFLIPPIWVHLMIPITITAKTNDWYREKNKHRVFLMGLSGCPTIYFNCSLQLTVRTWK